MFLYYACTHVDSELISIVVLSVNQLFLASTFKVYLMPLAVVSLTLWTEQVKLNFLRTFGVTATAITFPNLT